MLKNGFRRSYLTEEFRNKFLCGNKLPDKVEVEKCLELLQKGQLQLYKHPPTLTEVFHPIQSNDHIVISPWLIDSKFVRAINELPGKEFFVEIDWDVECYELSLKNIYKIDQKTDSIKIVDFWVEGFSDGRKITRIKDADELISGLFLETLPNDIPHGIEGVEIRPLQVLFRGLQLGSLIRLSLAAQKKKLCEISLDYLSGRNELTGQPNLLISNEHGDTALHIAAKTGEITKLPDDLVHYTSLFLERGQNGKTVLEIALKSGLQDWLVSKLTAIFFDIQEYWDELPDSLKVSITDLMKSKPAYWIWRLKKHPELWNQCPEFLQLESQIVQARKAGWIRRAENAPQQWNQCPEVLQQELQEDAAVVQILRSGWENLLSDDPDKWNDCPEFLKSEQEIARARKTGWVHRLERDPLRWNQCPEFLQLDSEIVQARKTGWIRRAENAPQQWNQCPEVLQQELQEDAAVVQILRSGWENLLSDDPDKWNDCPEFLKSEQEIARAHKTGWVQRLERDPLRWNQCPEHLQSNVAILQALKNGWINELEKTKKLTRPALIKRLLQSNILSLNDLPIEWRPEPITPLDQVRQCPWIKDDILENLSIQQADQTERKTIRAIRLKYWKVQVKKDWRNWSTMPPSLQQEEVVLKVMREGLGPEIRRAPGLWARLPEDYRQDQCLQRVHHYATRD